MALTIDNPDLEARLAASAQSAGLSVDNYAELLLSTHPRLGLNEGQANSIDDPWPADDRFIEHVERLLDEAVASGEPSEMTAEDWDDIRREGLALIRKRPA